MSTTLAEETIQSMKVCLEIEIAAPIEVAFDALLEELGPSNEMLGGHPFPMKLEPWPGGRWYRDLGNNTGHLWGHVQVIKPPTLLEITGPTCMSYPAVSHLQYRLTAQGNGTRIAFIHRAFGELAQEHREGMPHGWRYNLEKVRELAERRKGASR